MKLKFRFILFFVCSLIIFILFMGMFVAVSIEFIVPYFFHGMVASEVANIVSISIPFIIGGILFGMFFVNPLLNTLSLIRKLTTGMYDISEMDKKLYKNNRKLKCQYILYKELIDDISVLAKKLASIENNQKKLEEAKSNWISGVSHDLKTPLSYIIGYSSLLLTGQDELNIGENLHFITKIHDKSVYIAELIEDLNLSFKLDALEGGYPINLQKIDIVDFLRRILADIMNNPISLGYDFIFHSNKEILILHADYRLLSRAFQNLIYNAIHHTPKGTTINIIVTKNYLDAVIIKVCDNGFGMNEQTMSTLFDRYQCSQETKNSSGGFGLFVVKGIIEAHKGNIQFSSIEGKGTTFEIMIPILSS